MFQPLLALADETQANSNSQNQSSDIDVYDTDGLVDQYDDGDTVPNAEDQADISDDLESSMPFFQSISNQIPAGSLDPEKELTDFMSGYASPRLVLNADDYLSIKSLKCMADSDIIVDFENDMPNLLKYIPEESAIDQSLLPRPSTETDLLKMKLEKYDIFEQYVGLARQNWAALNKDNIAKNIAILTCIDSEVEDISSQDPEYIQALVDDAINSMKIDIRVLKMLNYLVTPKNQGGAGHYRIRVARISSGYNSKSLARRRSRESDAILEEKKQKTQSTTTYTAAQDFSGMTAAEIGMSRNVETVDTSSTGSLGQAEDQNGDTYEVYLDSQLKSGEKNISAHADGQAVDIASVIN